MQAFQWLKGLSIRHHHVQGQEEIEEAARQLRAATADCAHAAAAVPNAPTATLVVPLYGALSAEVRSRMQRPTKTSKQLLKLCSSSSVCSSAHTVERAFVPACRCHRAECSGCTNCGARVYHLLSRSEHKAHEPQLCLIEVG